MSENADWAKKAEDQEISSLVDKLDLERKDEEESTTKEVKENDETSAGLGTTSAAVTSSDEQQKGDYENLADTSLLMKIIRKGLVETKLDLGIQRKDPTSPLYSVKTFEALHLKPDLLKGVYAMGFNTPSKIQETAFPTLLADPPQNMIAQSQQPRKHRISKFIEK